MPQQARRPLRMHAGSATLRPAVAVSSMGHTGRRRSRTPAAGLVALARGSEAPGIVAGSPDWMVQDSEPPFSCT